MRTRSVRYSLTSVQGLELHGVRAKGTVHRGRRSLELTEAPDGRHGGDAMALVQGTDFGDGEIRVRLSGRPAPEAPPDMRGFVGVAFRVQPGTGALEVVYLRPTNGRADDQLRRNHATQYASHPDYPWHRLRAETPGVYESYVDLETDAWTDVRIRVSGQRAALFVGRAAQPCLVVRDLKLGLTRGAVGLWIGAGTIARFRALVISPES